MGDPRDAADIDGDAAAVVRQDLDLAVGGGREEQRERAILAVPFVHEGADPHGVGQELVGDRIDPGRQLVKAEDREIAEQLNRIVGVAGRGQVLIARDLVVDEVHLDRGLSGSTSSRLYQ